jgi:CRISPR/Cas system-associated exonuclease Cas4 (RecB family)
LCPGSARIEAGQHEDESKDARLGKLLHHFWARPEIDRAFLTNDQRDLLELSDRLMDDVLNRLAFETDHELFVEHQMTSRFDRFPGKADRLYIWPRRKAALIVDLKTGFIIVESADLNLQLRGYAVLVGDNWLAIEHVYVAILQPRLWSPSERITLARYEREDIERARRQVDAIIDESEKEKAPLRAGEEQCRFCKGRLICPAFRKALALPVQSFKSEADLSKAAREAFIEQRIKGCTDEQLEQVLEAVKLASYVDEPAHDEARLRIRNGQMTNLVLGKEYDLRNITNVRRAIAMLALAGIAKREDILDICDFSLKAVEERYRDAHKGMTWQQARDKINKVLASVIERSPCKPKIMKRK